MSLCKFARYWNKRILFKLRNKFKKDSPLYIDIILERNYLLCLTHKIPSITIAT